MKPDGICSIKKKKKDKNVAFLRLVGGDSRDSHVPVCGEIQSMKTVSGASLLNKTLFSAFSLFFFKILMISKG